MLKSITKLSPNPISPSICIGLLIWLFSLGLGGTAQGEVILKLSLHSDVKQMMTLASAVKMQQEGKFLPARSNRFNFGLGRSTHWAYLELHNIGEQPDTAILQISAPLVEQLDLFDLNQLPDNLSDLLPAQHLSGTKITRRPRFEFNISPMSRQTYLLRIQDNSSMPFEFQLFQPENIEAANSLTDIYHGVFYGILSFVGFASLIGYILFKEINFLDYCLMTLAQGFTLLVMEGFLRYLILPSHSLDVYNLTFSTSVHFALLSTLLFSYRFLGLSGLSKLCSRLFKAVGVLIILNLIFSIIGNFAASTDILALLCALSLISIFLASIIRFQLGAQGSGLFLSAFLIIECSIVMVAVQYLGVDLNFTSYNHSLRIGVFVETSLLLLAVMLRMQVVRRANEQNLQRLNEKNIEHAEKISEKNQELTRLDQLKDEFLANTTHELNTPLFGMLGLTERLLDTTSERLFPKEKDQLTLILSMGRRLTHLIHDILDFSSLKNSQLSLDIKQVDLVSLSNLVIGLIEPLTTSKKLNLRFDCDDHLPWIMADENRMQQILFNLLGNAVKFTHEGEVILRLREMPSSVSIEVKDTGMGIANKQWGRLFEPFVREHPEVIEEMGGSGLGLSITLQLIELQGGRLEMMSQPGRGTSFSFSLPIAEAKRSAPVAEAIPSQPASAVELDSSKITILVIDDEPGNIALLDSVLSSEGYQVLAAPGGMEGLEILEECKPDLMILDLMMPLINGYEVCREARRLFSSEELPILILTARNQVGDLEEAFRAGANDYITKPIMGQELLARLALHLKIKDSPNLDDRIALLEETQKELTETHESVLRLIERSPEPLILMDEKFDIVMLNHAAKALYPNVTSPTLESFFKSRSPVLRAAQNPKRQNPIAYAKLNDLDGDASLAPIANGNWLISLHPISQKPAFDSEEFRESLVSLMRLSLDYWEYASEKGKFELAEESGIWRVYNDDGRLRTRILDKYCTLKSLPKNPRYMDVIRTANFVLTAHPDSGGPLNELTDELKKFQSWV